MANVIYGSMTAQQFKAHDEAVLAAQLHLLEELKQAPTSASTRDYAEAFALVSGLLQAPIKK